MQKDIPSQQVTAWAIGPAAAAAAVEYITTQQISVWAPEAAKDIPTQQIQAWAPDHSNPFAGRHWRPDSVDTGAFLRAQKTDAVICEPSFDETAAQTAPEVTAKHNAEMEAEVKWRAHLYCLEVKRAREAANKEEARRIENALVPVVGAFSEEDILDYTGDWDLESSGEDSDTTSAGGYGGKSVV